MKTTNRLLLIACLALPFLAACQKEEQVPQETVAAPVPVPTTDNEDAWTTYLQDVVRRNVDDNTTSQYLYYLPPADSPGFEGFYTRQGEKMTTDLMRGVIDGTLLAYGSPESAKMADLTVKAFTDAEIAPGSMEGVRVLFIGEAADGERVKAAIAPTGAEYVFVPAE